MAVKANAQHRDHIDHARDPRPDCRDRRVQGRLARPGHLAPERLNALRHVATIESIGSSTRIEGSKLTDREVERLLANLEIKRFASRDEQEVAGYAEVMETVFRAWTTFPSPKTTSSSFTATCCATARRTSGTVANTRSCRNDVAAFDAAGNMIGVVFETASPFDTPRRMQELVAWLKDARELARLHPLLIIAVFIVIFLEIHPFQDGNGRLSRVLTTLLLLQSGYAYVPYSSLESVIEHNKEGYYLSLRQTQGTIRTDAPDWQPWLNFSSVPSAAEAAPGRQSRKAKSSRSPRCRSCPPASWSALARPAASRWAT